MTEEDLMTVPMPEKPGAASEDPARFIVAALRLFACPCSAPLHETLREDSPAAHLLQVMKTIDRHARRPLRLNPTDCRVLTHDEIAFSGLIAAAQRSHEDELMARCRMLVRAEGQSALADTVVTFASKLRADGIHLPETERPIPPVTRSVLTPVRTASAR